MISYVARKPPLSRGRRGLVAYACARRIRQGSRVHFAFKSVAVSATRMLCQGKWHHIRSCIRTYTCQWRIQHRAQGARAPPFSCRIALRVKLRARMRCQRCVYSMRSVPPLLLISGSATACSILLAIAVKGTLCTHAC